MLLAGAAGFALLVALILYLHAAGAKPSRQESLEVVEAYLKASYARDWTAAYRYISSRDQQVWDETSYASQYGNFTGFALDLARKLADSMEVWVMERQADGERLYYKVGYSVPAADELSALLFDWDPDRLNALSRSQQQQVLQTLESMIQTGKMITIKGQESFSLIADGGSWKIFQDWESGTKVGFKIVLPPAAGVDAQPLASEFLVKKQEAFQIVLKLKNQNKQPVVARIIHQVEPADAASYIDMIACGALQPITLNPGTIQEISSSYLIKDEIRPGTAVAITYDIQLEPMPSQQGAVSKPNRVNRAAKNAA